MIISLREVTIDNFKECVDLEVAEDQKMFVSSNVNSIAFSKVAPHYSPLAIYSDEELVGFTLSGRDGESKKYYIARLMIGEKFQGKGFGRATTLKLIDRMSENEDCNEIRLSFVQGNKGAEKLYSSLGFERTGLIDEDGEIEMSLDLKKAETRM